MTNRQYSKELTYFIRNVRYMAAVTSMAFLCFGYSAVHVTIGGDTLIGDVYLGEGNAMLAAGRFGMVLWAKLLGYKNAEPFYQSAIVVLSVAMLILAAIHFCMLLRRICAERISLLGYGLFSCAFISYPLMNEIWQYPGANSAVCGGYLLVAGALYGMCAFFEKEEVFSKRKLIRMVAISLLLMVVCSGYESLAVVYVFGVFMVLFLEQLVGAKRSLRKVIRRGIFFAVPLVAGVILRLLVHRALLLALGLTAAQNGDTAILWGTEPVFDTLWNVIRGCGFMYGLRAFVYLPITELVLAVLAFMVLLVGATVKKRDPLLLLTGAGMMVSLVLLAILQGKHTAYRTCQVFAVMVAFSVMALYETVRRWPKDGKVVPGVVGALLAVVCIHQGVYLNHLLVLDNLRSEEEAHVVRTIGTDLLRSCDTSKPIILTGEYELSDWMQEETTARLQDYPIYQWVIQKIGGEDTLKIQDGDKFVQTNVNSFLSKVAAYSPTERQRLFQYYGFDFSFSTSAENARKAEEYVKDHNVPGYPRDGYITESEDWIIVNLSAQEQ